MDSSNETRRRLDPNARFAIVYLALSGMFGVFTPYFQKLLSIQGFHEREIGFVFGMFETFGILALPLWGWLSDHSRHRRRILALAAAGTLGSFLAFGWIEDFWLALLAGAALGFFFRSVVPLLDGMALRYISEHGGDFGRMRVSGSVSFIVSILVSEALGVGGPAAHTIILGMAAFCLAMTSMSCGLLPLTERERAERNGQPPRQRYYDLAVFRSKPFIAITTVAFLANFSLVSHYSFFTLFLQKEFDFSAAGYAWIIGPIGEIFVVYFSSALIARLGVRAFFALGPAATALRLVGYAVAPSVEYVMALQVLHSFAYGASYFAGVYYVNRLVPVDMKQSAMSIFIALSMGVAGILGSSIGGIIIHQCGYRVLFAYYAVAAVLSVAGVVLFVRAPPSDGGGGPERSREHRMP
jgi:MFS transporter, PPP family, 3-phenylpropionic acid transporter